MDELDRMYEKGNLIKVQWLIAALDAIAKGDLFYWVDSHHPSRAILD